MMPAPADGIAPGTPFHALHPTPDMSPPQHKATSAERRPAPAVFTLFAVFGLSSWLTINAAFIELPQFASTLPEGWGIAASMGLAIQMANMFPLLYLFGKSRWGTRKTCAVDPLTVMLGVGTIATLFIALLWDKTADIGGKRRSLALLLLVFVAGGVDCTSSVTFWPFVSRYRSPYTAALAVGEGLSGLVPAIAGMIQDPAGKMRFTVGAFFVGMACLMAFSWVAFTVLKTWHVARQELKRVPMSTVRGASASVASASSSAPPTRAPHKRQTASTPDAAAIGDARGSGHGDMDNGTAAAIRSGSHDADALALTSTREGKNHDDGGDGAAHYGSDRSTPDRPGATASPTVRGRVDSFGSDGALLPVVVPVGSEHGTKQPSRGPTIDGVLRNGGTVKPTPTAAPHRATAQQVLVSLALLSFFSNGVLIALRPYATMPYIHGEAVLFWSAALATTVDPLAAALTAVPTLRYRNLYHLTAAWLPCALLLVVLAFMSPNPPGRDSVLVEVCVVALFVLTRALVSYTRAMAFMSVHDVPAPSAPRAQVGASPGEVAAPSAAPGPSGTESLARKAGTYLQLGAFSGSLLCFLLVEVGGVFQQG